MNKGEAEETNKVIKTKKKWGNLVLTK